MEGHALILITCGDREDARSIARNLVESSLAAGAQIMPIESVYRWQGDVVDDQEWLVLVKTRADRFEPIRSLVAGLHSYQVPPILMLEMAEGHRPYLDWIDQGVTETAP